MRTLADLTPEEWVEEGRAYGGPYTARDLRELRRVIDETEDVEMRKFYLRVYKLVEEEVRG